MSICWNPGSGDLDFDDDETYPTRPQLGSAKTVIVDKKEPLFYTADWVITATVNGQTIARSSSSPRSHSAAEVARWSREMYRRHKDELRRLGVDVEREYVRVGGMLSDLSE